MKKILALFFILILAASSEALAAKKTAKAKNKRGIISSKQIPTQGFADTVEKLIPTVVNISATQDTNANPNVSIDEILPGELPKSPLLDDFRNQVENQFRNQQGQKRKISSIGSGFIISKGGLIVTNNHVVEDSNEIIVSLYDGKKYKAKIVGVDKKTDLCLLKIDTDKDLKFVKFGDSNKARIGDWAIIIGNPYGLGGSVSVGIISARSRDIANGQSDDFIQTDAAINKGNSGGPMFNLKGEVIGISTAIFSPSGGSIGIGFARPSANVEQVIKQLQEQGEVTRGWLGISIQDVTDEIAESMKMEETKGAFVNEVTPDGPGDKAGILPTDIVIKFNDQDISEMKMLPQLVAEYPVGKTVKLEVLRQGKIKNLSVKIEKMKEENEESEIKPETKALVKKQAVKPAAQVLGLGLVELNSDLKKEHGIDKKTEGLLIVEVGLKSEAAEKGILPGDILLSVNQEPIDEISDFKDMVSDAANKDKKLFLFFKRGEKNYGIVLASK
jgi:serine protease Do